MWQAIIGGVSGIIAPVTTHFTRRRELKSAEHQAKIAIVAATGERQAALIREGLTADMQWEEAMVAQAGSGWKDEATFLLVSIPFGLCFWPAGAVLVSNGFDAIGKMPDWFVLLATTIMFANYGIRFWRRSQYDTPATSHQAPPSE
jgi:hypothetical protein